MNTKLRTALRVARVTLSTLGLLVATNVQSRELDSFTLRLDNDFPAGTDYHYTSGTEFVFTYAGVPGQSSRTNLYRSLTLGQAIFTPQDKEAEEIVVDDRPYAGWSYLRYGWHREKPGKNESVKLTLGMVGPSSFGEDIQRAVHDLIDDETPIGWKNQLSDEFGYNLEYSRDQIRFNLPISGEWSAQISEGSRVALGNIDSSASQGVQMRFGYRLPNTPQNDRIGSPVGEVDSKALYRDYPRSSQPRQFYFLLGGNAKYVAQNLFLDGNSNNRSHSVEKKSYVSEFEYGFAYSKPGFKISVVMVRRSKEFEGQEDAQDFGSIAFTFKR